MSLSKTFRLFFLALFLSPYILLLIHWHQFSLPPSDELLWVFKNSLLQSFLSSALAMALGFWWGRGLLHLQSRLSMAQQRGLEFLLLLPNFLPALFILLIFLSVWTPFPFGLTGVIVVHGFMNASLAALFFKDLLKAKLEPIAELCWVEGASLWSFWKKGFHYLWNDFLWIFAFVFILCFTSFAVPLIAGGGKVMTFELAIYDKMRNADWNQAVGVAFLQFGFLILFSGLPLLQTAKQEQRGGETPYLRSQSGAFMAICFSLFWVAVFCWQVFVGIGQITHMEGLWSAVGAALPLSLMLGFGVGLLILLFLLFSAFTFPDPWIKRFFLGFVAPSTALIGFVFAFMTPWLSMSDYARWLLAFSILIFASLYRWGWIQRLESLRGQIQVAQTLGANAWFTFRKIILPQSLDLACRLAAVAALWGLGDFALAKIVISRPATLALIAESLMSSYRIEAAMTVTAVILLAGAFLFLVFQGVENVIRRKFI
jgi:thiamine transport system permease protein